MQEKLKTASYLEQIEILTLVPDKWSPMCNVFVFNVFEYLVWTSHEIKKLDEYWQNLLLKKEKLSPLKHFFFTISVGMCLEIKTMLLWVKEYINKNLATCKSLCNLQELYTAFKEKHPNVNTRFPTFCALRLKWCVLASLKMTHSICVCSAHRNVLLLVDAIEWDLR